MAPEVADASELPKVALGHVTVRAIVRDDKFGKPHGLLFVGECGRLLHAEADSSEEQALWLVRGSQWVIRGSC